MEFKEITIMIVVVAALVYGELAAQSNAGLSSNWSKFQGKMNWNKAKAKCANIGMRLPTKAEGIAAFKAGLTQSWEKDGVWYWTSVEGECLEGCSYCFTVGHGIVSTCAKDYDDGCVRCIR